MYLQFLLFIGSEMEQAADILPHADQGPAHITLSVISSQILPRFNIKTIFPRYGDSHVKDKTVVRPYHLYYAGPYTGKTTFLNWDNPQVPRLLTNINRY